MKFKKLINVLLINIMIILILQVHTKTITKQKSK